MSDDLTPEQQDAIILKLLGEKNYDKFIGAKKNKVKFRPEPEPPLWAEFFQTGHSDNEHIWTLHVKRGNKLIKEHKSISDKTRIKLINVLRNKGITVKRFYYDWDQKGKDKRKQPSTRKQILNKVGNIRI